MISEHLDPLLESFETCIREWLSLKSQIETDRYDDFGNTCEQDRYSIDAAEKYERMEQIWKTAYEIMERIKDEAQISSLYMARLHAMSLCEDYMDDCRCFVPVIEKHDGLEILYVKEESGEYKELVDVAERIDQARYRNMLDTEIAYQGKTWAVLSFIPERYRLIYEAYRDMTDCYQK